ASLLDFFKRKKPEAPAAAPPPEQPLDYRKDIKPILEQYCWDCHADGMKKGGFSFDDHSSETALLKDRHIWEMVSHNVSQKIMPPEKKPQPSEAERAKIARWVETEVFKIDPKNPDPGRVTIRRLNRQEYNNTIRDLVGVDFQPADDFPADDSGYGFDNIGDVLSIPPVLLEKYLAAADNILSKAIVVGPPKPAVRRVPADQISGGMDSGGARALISAGELTVKYQAPVDDEYNIRVRAFEQRAGPDPARMGLRIDGKEVKVFDVRASRQNPDTYSFKARLPAGARNLAVAFLNDYYNTDSRDRRMRGDRNLYVDHFEIEGPLTKGKAEYPETHRRIFVRQPTGPADRMTAAREIIASFTRRAYRRPVTDEEVTRLLRFVELAEKDGQSFEAGIKLALSAVLVSPQFLFRGELQPEPNNPKVVHPINEYALASRLSYFLWSSMPDDELFKQAEQGTLRRNLGYQVARMMKDPRADAFVDNFAGQWLQLRNLDLASPDRKLYSGWDDKLRDDMKQETKLFFRHIMHEDRSVLDFLTGDYTFLNERLARHYGIDGVKGDNFQYISLRDTQRGGVLTQGSILTITSNPTRTSPVKRGLWVLENLLATPPPPPPPDVPPLAEDKKASSSASLRERLEIHRKDPTCASCHERMDPLGFGLENFDAVGAWRDKDEGFKIDPSGKLVSGEVFQGPKDLNSILVKTKRKEFLRCLAEKMLTYALGRGLEYYDKPALDEIVSQLEKNRYKFSALIMETVKSVPFQLRRGEGDRLAGDS
ncbi:MAG: DUF1592 domain-containing protein, partial [Verrucomicrobiota bacterium]